MSNTIIQIKRSDATSQPANLSAGEFAYSYLSNTLFLGTTDGTGVINVGGLLYTQTIDAATAANTANTLVKRRSDGAFFGQLFGNANTATALQTGRYIGINQGDVNANSVYFDGTGNANVALVLSTMANVTAGQYGSTTAIPVITVAANGRVSNISTVAIDTQFTVAGNTGSGTQAGGGTLTIQGGNTGIVTTVTGSGGSETVTIGTDNTVVRSNTTVGGTQIINTALTVGNDLVIQGNLSVLGTSTTINTSSIVLNDPLLYLAGNNYTSDAVDIGFVAHYNDGANAHTGLFRDPNLKEYIFFKGYTPEVEANNLINIAHPSFAYSNVIGDFFKGNLISNTATSDGFYGKTTTNLLNLYPSHSYNTVGDQYIIVDPTAPNHIHLRAGGAIDSSNAELFLGGENTGVQVSDNAKEVYITANGKSSTFNNNGTVTLFGKVTANGLNLNDFSQAAFNKANSAIFNSGGDLTVGSILIGAGGNNLTTLANTTYTQLGTLSSNNTITSITVDAYGRFTNSTVSAISGLTVPQGGTGLATITQNGITYGNGVGTLGVTAAAGGADQTWSNQLLTVTNAGVPVWTTTLDGGKF